MLTSFGRPDLRHNGDVTTEAPTPTGYLRANAWVESDHPDVVRLGTELRAEHLDDVDFARASFEWARDEVAHSTGPEQTSPPATRRAPTAAPPPSG